MESEDGVKRHKPKVSFMEHPGEEGGSKGESSAGECVHGERGWGQEAQTKGQFHGAT